MSETIPRVAILASGDRESGGGGSTADFVARDALRGVVSFDIGVVICNNAEGSVGVYPRFEAINEEFGLKGDSHIDVINISGATHPKGKLGRGQTLSESAAICRLLEEREIDFVSMEGYMKKLTGEFLESWGWWPAYALDPTYSYRQGLYHPNARTMNNHPAILDFTADTHGPGAHQKAIELRDAGVLKYSAMTWHLASEKMDDGPVIDEEPVPILEQDDADSLGDRIQDREKALTALVLDRHLILRAEHLRGNS